MFWRRPPSLALPAEDLADARAMVERLHDATWKQLVQLGAYDEQWAHLPHGGIPKGQLSSEPDPRVVREAHRASTNAASVIQFTQIPKAEPLIADPTYVWTDARFAPMLWAVSDAVRAVGLRSVLSDEDYAQLTAPWRRTLGSPRSEPVKSA
jgi:hypothetical protein